MIGGLRDKMAGLAGNLLKLSYKNLTNATIIGIMSNMHVFNHATAIMETKDRDKF
mgnify:CR=1 FL=1